MTNEQIRLRILFDTAITRHYRSLLDAARTTPALLDDLVAVAETYATEHARGVTARQQLRAEAAVPVAAIPEVAGGGAGTTDSIVPLVGAGGASAEGPQQSGATGGPGPSHRTRTRTRGGAK